MGEIHHLHLEMIVAHGRDAVLRLHEVDAADARIGGCQHESGQHFREGLLSRRLAQHLVEIADHDAAGRWFRIRIACKRGAAITIELIHVGAHALDDFVEAGFQKFFLVGFEVAGESHLTAERVRGKAIQHH